MDPITLPPFLVQELLELFVSHELLMPIEDGDIEVGVMMALI